MNGEHFTAYLREVLTRIADYPINRIEELLPLEHPLHSCRSVYLTDSRTLSKTVHFGRLRTALRVQAF